MGFLPLTRAEMISSGIKVPDFVFVSGDAYIDHPSFGVAIISRILERHGYSVVILSQPDISNKRSFLEFGFPRLGWLVSSGNIDSMVNNYTVAKNHRRADSYSPGGKIGKRPDRAVIRYSNIIRELDPMASIILGGIEASLRRLAHYDYWSDQVMKSILIDAKADLIVYGMAESAVIDVADALASGLLVSDLTFLLQTVFFTKNEDLIPKDAIYLDDYETIKSNKAAYAKTFMTISSNQDPITAKTLVETYPEGYVIHHPPKEPLGEYELDHVYELPFQRKVHPAIEKEGRVPAIEEVRFSLVSNRGCFGGCSFCALTVHQGRRIQSRSQESLVSEAKLISGEPDFKGYIHDVGGPTANFQTPSCKKQEKYGVCPNRQCIGFKPCPELVVDHKKYLETLTAIRNIEGIKKVFIRSGIRYDYLLYDNNDLFFHELVQNHISGQLKVAPEHVSSIVLQAMNKPDVFLFDEFAKKYDDLNVKYGKRQFLVPYFMSSHPGSRIEDAILLAEYIRDRGYVPEQVQDFYPTPMTLSTAMYHTGLDPRTMKPIYVAKSPHEKAMQRALIQYKNPKNYKLVKEALIKAGRQDLIGSGGKCLIKSEPPSSRKPKWQSPKKRKSQPSATNEVGSRQK